LPVRIDAIGDAELTTWLIGAWFLHAPKRLPATFLG
jgi:hypothetical protein